jgi:hypothetical protein
MANEALLNLQHSESVVAQMAATIFAGMAKTSEADDALIERSAAIAIKLAVRVEKLVKSDEEWLKKDMSSSLRG